MELRETIEEYIQKSNLHPGYTNTTVKNLLVGNDAMSPFWKAITQKGTKRALTNEEYSGAVKETVLGYTSKKNSAIDIFKQLEGYINRKLELNLHTTFPPIDASNTFERQMYISKYLQSPEHKISDLSEILWVGERTIDKDLRKLRGRDNDPIQINGKRFVIPDTTAWNDRLSFASTVHPLFLTENLTQVLVLLQGLKTMCSNPQTKEYAYRLACEVWSQLSQYAKDRIMYVLPNLMNEDTTWYEQLEDICGNTFFTERECSRHDVTLDCLKNQKTCCIEYKSGNKTKFIENARILGWEADVFSILTQDSKRMMIPRGDIVRSAYTKEGLV